MKITRVIWILAVMMAFLAYIGSYVGMSRQGHYEPVFYGLLQGPEGQAILAPKALGYVWHPFPLGTKAKGVSKWTYFYLPLLTLDHRLWHPNDGVLTFEYPVKSYFDSKTFTYRDIEPKNAN